MTLREVTEISELKDIVSTHISSLNDIINQSKEQYEQLKDDLTAIYNDYMVQVKAGNRLYNFDDVGTVVKPSGDYVLNHEMDYDTYITHFKYMLNKFTAAYNNEENAKYALEKIIKDNAKSLVHMLVYVENDKIYILEK